MKIYLSFIILLCSLHSFADCEFKPSVNKVVSLAGPATVTLKELGLLNHPKLKGISVFNPVKKNEFKGKIYPGGIFMSQGYLNELKDAVVFIDESRELTRILKSSPSITFREFKNRNLVPSDTIEATINILNEFISGCEEKIKTLNEKKESLLSSIASKLPKKINVVFYLGKFMGERRPEMIVVQDGIVKWLIDKKKISTYPSELPYVSWSARLMNNMPADTLHIGIEDTGMDGEIKIKRSPKWTTLFYPGALVPGISQLEAFDYLFKNL